MGGNVPHGDVCGLVELRGGDEGEATWRAEGEPEELGGGVPGLYGLSGLDGGYEAALVAEDGPRVLVGLVVEPGAAELYGVVGDHRRGGVSAILGYLRPEFPHAHG